MADYPNRADLRNPATRKVNFTGQSYGQAAQQARAQQAVAPGSAPTTVQAQQAARAAAPRPGARPFLRPTERPDEPITSGADFGAGPSALQAGIRPRIIPEDNILDEMRALYALYPTEELAQLISKYGNRGF